MHTLFWIAAATFFLTFLEQNRLDHLAATPWYAIDYPLMSALFVFILLRTMLLNLWQGGIRWRGTFYSLKELKKNRI